MRGKVVAKAKAKTVSGDVILNGLAFGIWHLAFGISHLAFGIWHFAFRISHETYPFRVVDVVGHNHNAGNQKKHHEDEQLWSEKCKTDQQVM